MMTMPQHRRIRTATCAEEESRGASVGAEGHGDGLGEQDSEAGRDYRLNFGKHRGRLLSQIPASYVEWLIRDGVYASRPDLHRSLVAWGHLPPEDKKDGGAPVPTATAATINSDNHTMSGEDLQRRPPLPQQQRKQAQSADRNNPPPGHVSLRGGAGPMHAPHMSPDTSMLGWSLELRAADLKKFIPLEWRALLGETELSKKYWGDLATFLRGEVLRGKTIYPPQPEVFKALHLCKVSQVKVVILGQDPYHGEGQAEGLSFSVKKGVPLPSSLKNIFKEVASDLRDENASSSPAFQPRCGSLTPWAEQGVLLLNAALTVRANEANSHRNKGWEQLTSALVDALNERHSGLVFLLWGRNAQQRGVNLDRTKHLVLTAAHPSGLSANRGFFGCKHFSKTNQYLERIGKTPIRWAAVMEANNTDRS